MQPVLWDWSYSGGGSLGGSGTFTTNDGPSPYLITGITGTVENRAITELYPPNSLGVFNDNLLYSTFPQLTENGVPTIILLYSTFPQLTENGVLFSFMARASVVELGVVFESGVSCWVLFGK